MSHGPIADIDSELPSHPASRGCHRRLRCKSLWLHPFGYRPKRTAHEAVDRVARAIVQQKTRVIDIDLRSYFDNVRHDRLLAKVHDGWMMQT